MWEIIDTATSHDELNTKEEYWIQYYDACNVGYNTSPGGCACGGNTYFRVENLDQIRKKISKSKLGGKNPNSRAVVMTDINNNAQKIFSSMQEAADYLGLASHMPVSRRCRKYTKRPLNGRYQFEYCNDEGVTTIENTVARL